METKKKERSVLRASVTRLAKEIEHHLAEIDPDLNEIQSMYDLISQRFQSLRIVDEAIFELLLESDVSEEELGKDLDARDAYEKRFSRIKFSFDNVKGNSGLETHSVAGSDKLLQNKRKFKLPKVEFKRFSGDVKGWLPFWNQFRKIHEDESIDPSDKIQYLFQATLPESPARRIVESFPDIDKNYEKIITRLQDRFGRDDLQIEVYVRELLTLIIENSTHKESCNITLLYDKIETQLRSLETLGVTTDKSTAILFPLVESCLPEELLRIWQRGQGGNMGSLTDTKDVASCEAKPVNRLENLLAFLKNEVQNEQRISLAAEGFGLSNVRQQNFSKRIVKKVEDVEVPTATGFINCEVKCIFCAGSHKSRNCFKAKRMSVDERKGFITKSKACFRCLQIGHQSRRCKEMVKCFICGKAHVMLMCQGPPFVSSLDKLEVKTEPNKHDNRSKSVTMANHVSDPICLQTLKVQVSGPCGIREVRALIDSASQRSYILKSTAGSVGIKPLGVERVAHALFGGVNTAIKEHQMFAVEVGGKDYSRTFEMLGEDIICSSVPPVPLGPWIHQLDSLSIGLSDNLSGPIEVLFGTDVCATLETGMRHALPCGLVAIETYFGWSIIGRVRQEDLSLSMAAITVSLFASVADISRLWDLDVLGIKEPFNSKTQHESALAAKEFFVQTISFDEEGRYTVRLPWLEGHPPLPDNFSLAKKRLDSTLMRLRSKDLFEDYNSVFLEWLREGIIEEAIGQGSNMQVHYLPHRPVVKEGSTTRIRPVFDASAHSKGNPCLNDCLERGVNLIEKIPSIMYKFRARRIGVVADIKKAFLQISVHPSDCDVLRFLWISSDGELRIFRHKRVVFGVNCSPFLLGATIEFHLLQLLAKSSMPSSFYSGKTIEKLLEGFYVDNCLVSFDDEKDAQQFILEATRSMSEAKFELRGWEMTNGLSAEPASPLMVLGLLWNPWKDSLCISGKGIDLENTEETERVVTKRFILSCVSKLFDPIGFTCPAMIVPKLLLQRTWKEQIGWDSPVGEDTKKKFLEWLRDISWLSSIEIPRWTGFARAREASIHTFCDASQDAYATVVFLRIANGSDVLVNLLAARSRVAPLKRMTIPRLELMAATIGARLYDSVVDSFESQIRNYFWSDSTTVISWIRGSEEWSTFVSNRVQEIRRLTQPAVWRHIPGQHNPADLPSRGCSPRSLGTSRWWEGPQWLYLDESQWPSESLKVSDAEVNEERKKGIVVSMLNSSSVDWHLDHFSKYMKTLRMVAWIFRYVNNLKGVNVRITGTLSVKEIEFAEIFVLKIVQSEVFSGKQVNISGLASICGQDGLVRLKSRVLKRDDTLDFRYPILLPAQHVVVRNLIKHYHLSNCHVGTQGLLSILRERFWVIGGRRTVRSVINKCVVCRRHSSKRCEVVQAPLPLDRVRDAKVFEVSGVDFAGPLYLASKQKAWICLFTCAVYRAVHLELTTSLSTHGFLQVLRRFIARRGRPSTIYSDIGTNFVGTNNSFSDLNWDVISEYSTARRIQWMFNPPTAAWWGGYWERLIGMLKQLLRRVLGRSSLSFEDLMTIVCDCEAVVNSRPITYLSEDASDLSPLTPAMFLHELDEVGVPDCDVVEYSALGRRISYRNSIRDALRSRFRNEYLGQLRVLQESKTSRPLSIGDVVLVGNDSSKRLDWPLGRVVELIPGRDGENRLVRVETARGSLLRPVQRLYLLEAVYPGTSSTSSTNEPQRNPQESGSAALSEVDQSAVVFKDHFPIVTKGGRVVKRPKKFEDFSVG